MYEYAAKVIRVKDGDTVVLDIDLGFKTTVQEVFRLYGPDPSGDMGINAPELSTESGQAAKKFLEDMLTKQDGSLIIHTIKDRKEKYGRYLAVIYILRGTDRVNVNQTMLDAKHATLQKY